MILDQSQGHDSLWDLISMKSEVPTNSGTLFYI